ncbi:MAG: hypothetical protein WBF13_10130 [Candidatus Zixiibacteriota bacterium]
MSLRVTFNLSAGGLIAHVCATISFTLCLVLIVGTGAVRITASTLRLSGTFDPSAAGSITLVYATLTFTVCRIQKISAGTVRIAACTLGD